MNHLRTTTAIAEAISKRRLLAFSYHGRERVVEPHTFGLDRWGRTLLSAYQVECENAARAQQGWRFFFVDQLANVRVDPRGFVGARPDYVRADGAFKSITAQL